MAASDILAAICSAEQWAGSSSEAAELAAKWEGGFLTKLKQEYESCAAGGRVCRFTFNTSSAYMIQGVAFIEGGESDGLKEAKRRRGRLDGYLKVFDDLTPTDFEAMCRGILGLIGVKHPSLTPRSSDEGIDFFGRLSLENLSTLVSLPNVYRRMSVWMVGQAKKYGAIKAGTPDIRELVGAVILARGKAFGGSANTYSDLDILPCDPVFYLFFTTGSISTDGWRLLERSGAVGMDGLMVAAFLADHGVGVIGDILDSKAVEDWIVTHRNAP